MNSNVLSAVIINNSPSPVRLVLAVVVVYALLAVLLDGVSYKNPNESNEENEPR